MARSAAFAFIAASALFNNVASADLILNINITDPAAVVVSSTGANADVNDSSSNVGEGIILRLFLTADTISLNNPDGMGNLIGGSSGVTYSKFLTRAASGALGARDANVFTFPLDSTTQTFSTSTPAFTGSNTWDLSGISTLLPPIGATGDIFAGDQDGVGPSAIGQWVAVPEPSAFLTLGAVSLLLGTCYFVKKQYRKLSRV